MQCNTSDIHHEGDTKPLSLTCLQSEPSIDKIDDNTSVSNLRIV